MSVRYRCNVCNVFEYDEGIGDRNTDIKPGTKPEDFPEEWRCPICAADKTHLKLIKEKEQEFTLKKEVICPKCGTTHTISIAHVEKVEEEAYLGEWERESDELENHMADIHKISASMKSVIEPMRTKESVISWDDILIKGSQLARIPLSKNETVNTRTIIGKKAKHPLIIETPIYITHMSFGALSREVKIALAKGVRP